MNFLLALALILTPLAIFIFKREKTAPQRTPPGSLGLPLLGQSLGLLRAMKTNTAEKWLHERVKQYGPVSKLSLFGTPTVFIFGPEANKFVFASSDGSTITNQQTQSVRMILGDRCLLELNGEDHKRVRGALASFLKPESLKMYVGKTEMEVKRHIQMHWEGKQQVTVLPLMKNLTFNIICSLLFGIESQEKRDEYVDLFQEMISGMWSVPVNIPFTCFSRSLKASAKVQQLLKQLLKEKRKALSGQDLISTLLSIHGGGEDREDPSVSEDEIVHNVMLIMTAGHDTSSVLITFILRVLANNPAVYEAVLKEQDEIAKGKIPGEALTWQDLSKMKYTWKVAQETLRVFPPLFGGFRKTVRDVEFGGYLIPKGWQIFWATSMTHSDSSIFLEPEKFDPERFDSQSSIPPYCFVPFGAGPRICPGYEFAKIETLVTLHHLVTRFKWKLCYDDNIVVRDPMPRPTKGMPIQITPRTWM